MKINTRKDGRGNLIEVFKGNFSQCNVLLMKKGSIWGGHYHNKTKEFFYLLSGEMRLKLSNLKSQKTKIKIYKTGDFFIISPRTLHQIKVLKQTKCLVLYSRRFSRTNPDK